MADPEQRSGGCLCGALRYTVTGDAFMSEYCHCRMCQRVAGAAFANWIDFKVEQVRWDKGKPTEYASSERFRRGFCSTCGSSVSGRDTGYPDYYSLNTASLDDPEAFPPTRHIFVESQMPWLDVQDSCERFKRGPGG